MAGGFDSLGLFPELICAVNDLGWILPTDVQDETIPLIDVLDWARPQELTVQVVPGADHFFHRRLHCIRNIITSAWLGMSDHRN